MAVTNPTDGQLTAYAGNTFSYKFTFVKDGTDDPIDLASDYSEITFKIFKRGKIDSPDIEYTVGDGHSILNTNELVGSIPADSDSETDTQDLFGSVRFFEVRLKNAVEDDAFWVGRFIVNNYASGGGEQSADVEVTVNQTTHEISISEATNSAASAAGHEAKAKQYADNLNRGTATAENDKQPERWNQSKEKWEFFNQFGASPLSVQNSIWEPNSQPNARDYTDPENADADQFITDLWEPLRNEDTNYITRSVLGQDESGNYDIYKYVFEPETYEKTIVIGCNMHGGEVMSQLATHRFLYNVVHNWTDSPHLAFARWKVRWVIIPMVNPWGVSQSTRVRENSNDVDINRNWDYRWENYSGKKGASAFSESETQIFRDLVSNDYPNADAVIDTHSFVGQDASASYYLIYTANVSNAGTKGGLADLIEQISRDSESFEAKNNLLPQSVNYFSANGFNSSNPEWTFNASGMVEKYDSTDMTEAVRWYANLYLDYATASTKNFAVDKGFAKQFEFDLMPTAFDSTSYTDILPDYTFNVIRSGLLLMNVNTILRPDTTDQVWLRPYFGQDGGFSQTGASNGSFNMEVYQDVPGGDDRLFNSQQVIPVHASETIRMNLQGKTSTSGTSVSVRRGSIQLIFLPFDGDLFEAFRWESGDTTKWYEKFPEYESSP